jgi:hypothetical protein
MNGKTQMIRKEFRQLLGRDNILLGFLTRPKPTIRSAEKYPRLDPGACAEC